MRLSQRLAHSAIVIALYVVITALNPASSGLIQVRLSTGLYALAAFRPDLIPALALGNSLANLLIGQGPLDAALGLVVGLVTSVAAWLVGKTGKTWLVPLPIALVVPPVVSTWLSLLLHVPYKVTLLYLLVGQSIAAVTAGALVTYVGVRLFGPPGRRSP
ncbi:MAG: QueT transporter family protein [Symbiobacteriia bacterium]